jgi:hypothetical protein
MKVKGWVVVCTLDEDLTPLNAGDKNKILFFNIKKEAKEWIKDNVKNNYFKAKPCTITIHDKAVKG